MAASIHAARRLVAAVAAALVAAPIVVAGLSAPAHAAAVPLYPDLKTLPPRELRFDRADVTADLSGDFHNVLRFSNDTYNVGQGPLLLNATIDPNTLSGPSSQRVMNSDGTFTDYALHNDIYWHAAHHHYHFDHWGTYQLWTKAGFDAWNASGRTSGAPIYTGVKTTSCVTDEEFIKSVPNAVFPGPYGLGGCDTGTNFQIHMGLSVGWGDTYDWYRQEQWIDLGQNTLGNGTYVLRSVADPLNIVYESANRADAAREGIADNEAETTFVVQGGAILDSDPPTGTVTINHVDRVTTQPKVTVSVTGRDDVSEPSQFRLSNGSHFATFTYTSSGSVPTNVRWNLADPKTGGTAKRGTHTVYARVRDHSGKWGPVFEDTIDYEPGPPPPPAGSYAATVTADKPAGYWRLNEGSGATAADSGGSNPGIYNGAVTRHRPSLLVGDHGYSVAFSGAGQSVGIPSSAPLSPAATVSVEAWIKPGRLPPAGSFASIVTKPESYALQLFGSKLEFTLMEGGARHRVRWAGSVSVGKTYHVVGTYDGATGRLYVNGRRAASLSFNDSITTNANAVHIASWDGSSEFYRGAIDEAAVYPIVLSAAQVAEHYRAGTHPVAQTAARASNVSAAHGRVQSASELSAPVAVDAGLRRTYLPCDRPADDCVRALDTETRSVMAEIPVESSWRPSAIAVNPRTHLVYVTSAVFAPDSVQGRVTVIDGRTDQVVGVIPIGPGPQAIAVDPVTDRIFVTAETGIDGDAAVTVIDGVTRRIVATVPIGPYARYFPNPSGIAVDVVSNTVYASNPLEGVVYAIDGASAAVVRSIVVGDTPSAIAVDPRTRAVVVTTARGPVVIGAV